MTNRAWRLPTLLAVGAILLLSLAGCGASGSAPAPSAGASVSGSLDEQTAGDQMPFQIPVARAGDPIGVDLRGVVEAGSLRVQLVDASGQVVWQEE
ncbi:MAG: hypothetical protein PVG56_09065, partial [Anaerolineae bacterium]